MHAIVRYPVVVKIKTAVKNGTSAASKPLRDVVTVTIHPELRQKLDAWKARIFCEMGTELTDGALVRYACELWLKGVPNRFIQK